MNKLKWIFMSKYKKLLYQIECAKERKCRLTLKDGTIISFEQKANWIRVHPKSYPSTSNLLDEGKYYYITRRFPTGNYKLEIIKADSFGRIPDFVVAIAECDIKPYKLD